MIKENNDKELSVEQKDRFSKLTTLIDQFEETSLTYGPASSNELKNRINKSKKQNVFITTIIVSLFLGFCSLIKYGIVYIK